MTALTSRQRVQVNAALAMIYRAGHDANAIGAAAREYQSQGHSASRAYTLALNAFARDNVDLAAPLARALDLLTHSDDATLAKYDDALSVYNQTGDETAFDQLAPMVAQDVVALAIRNGEVPAGADSATMEAALGYAPTADMIAALEATRADATSVPEAAPATAERFAFNHQLKANEMLPTNSNTTTHGPASGSATASGGRLIASTGSVSAAHGRAGHVIPQTSRTFGAAELSPGAVRSGKTGEALAREIGVPLAYAVAQGMIPAQDS